MDESFGVRELKNKLSSVLRQVKAGQRVVVTEREIPVAVIIPFSATDFDQNIGQLCKMGFLSWAGGKPKGCKKPPKTSGPSVSDAVLEDRR